MWYCPGWLYSLRAPEIYLKRKNIWISTEISIHICLTGKDVISCQTTIVTPCCLKQCTTKLNKLITYFMLINFLSKSIMTSMFRHCKPMNKEINVTLHKAHYRPSLQADLEKYFKAAQGTVHFICALFIHSSLIYFASYSALAMKLVLAHDYGE